MSSDKHTETETVIKRAGEISKLYNLKYVTSNELFCAIVEHEPVKAYFRSENVDTDSIITYLHNTFVHDIKLERNSSIDSEIILATGFKRILEQSYAQALFLQRDMQIIDLLYALLTDTFVGKKFATIIQQSGGDSEKIIAALKLACTNYNKSKTSINNPKTTASADTKSGGSGNAPTDVKKSALEEFCINVNQLAKEGKIDPVIGRDKDIKKILQTLGRKNKQNCILVGESGTGKTAIIDGLAIEINEGRVPAQFKDAIIYSLDLGGLVAGTKFRGEFEERLKNVIDELKSNTNNILFIDEIHMLRGAGAGSDNAMDASNILKPALASRAIKVIGATTHDEYRKHFEKDRALMRRFFKLDINEPSAAETKEILRGAIKHFESYHNIAYDVEALDMAVDLAEKYMHDKRFPDKALDIIDSVGSTAKLFGKDHTRITVEDIEREVSIITKIPQTTVKKDDNTKLKNLEISLKSSIYGQDHVIEQVVNYILMAKSGLRNIEKPLMTALFRGQTGVGKTELAKQLAKQLDIELIRFDMSEYSEKHSVSKLIGAPPGYVGHGEGSVGSGLLINAIETNPHCVLLLDEIEKADPQVLNILLQVMDYGMLTSSTGKTVSFRNAIIIMSSNLGAKDMDKNPIGFGRDTTGNTHDVEATNDHFAPEFRNRLDVIVSFNKLNDVIMTKILDKFVNQTNKMLEAKGVKISLTDKTKEYFIKETVSKNMGARPIDKMISEKIKQPLSKKLLFEAVTSEIIVDMENSEIVFVDAPVAITVE